MGDGDLLYHTPLCCTFLLIGLAKNQLLTKFIVDPLFTILLPLLVFSFPLRFSLFCSFFCPFYPFSILQVLAVVIHKDKMLIFSTLNAKFF